nr:MAG TPA: hypothetical protein [Caudoviricetes sp.]
MRSSDSLRHLRTRNKYDFSINSLKNKMKVKIKKLDHNAIMPTEEQAAMVQQGGSHEV